MAFAPQPTAADLAFLAGLVPGVRDRREAARRLAEDPRLLADALDDPRALERLWPPAPASPPDVSPWLLFAVLLRAATRDLDHGAVIPEWAGPREVVPLFDGREAARALHDPDARREMERLLTAFTRADERRFAVYEDGHLRRLVVHSLDPDSMRAALPYAQGEVAGDLLRRMADAYLFLAGVFPDHVVERRGEPLDAWERRGQGLYRTAAAHYEEVAPAWARRLEGLAASFHPTRRALNYLSERYLADRRRAWFTVHAPGA